MCNMALKLNYNEESIGSLEAKKLWSNLEWKVSSQKNVKGDTVEFSYTLYMCSVLNLLFSDSLRILGWKRTQSHFFSFPLHQNSMNQSSCIFLKPLICTNLMPRNNNQLSFQPQISQFKTICSWLYFLDRKGYFPLWSPLALHNGLLCIGFPLSFTVHFHWVFFVILHQFFSLHYSFSFLVTVSLGFLRMLSCQCPPYFTFEPKVISSDFCPALLPPLWSLPAHIVPPSLHLSLSSLLYFHLIFIFFSLTRDMSPVVWEYY